MRSKNKKKKKKMKKKKTSKGYMDKRTSVHYDFMRCHPCTWPVAMASLEEGSLVTNGNLLAAKDVWANCAHTTSTTSTRGKMGIGKTKITSSLAGVGGSITTSKV